MAKDLLYAVLVVPIMLVISLAVFSGFHTGTQSSFEGAVINETFATKADTTNTTYYTTFYGKLGSGTLYNGSALCNTGSTCQIDYSDGVTSKIKVVNNSTGAITLKYTPYNKGNNGTDYNSYVATYKSALTGYNMGALVPYILAAMTVVGVIIAALVIKG